MTQIRHDVLSPDEIAGGTGRRNYDAENAKVNDLGWSDRQRRDAIEEIISRHKLKGADARTVEGHSDTYLQARVEAGRTHERGSSASGGGGFTRPAPALTARANADAAVEAEAAYARSVANLNAWRK